MSKTLVRLLLAVALLLPGAVVGTPWASAQQAAGDSAVTQSVVCPPASQAPNCQSEFGDLKVTVSQTKNLIDQIVQVSWTGGKPTPPDNGTNFLQMMQCWGGDSGPDPTQCYFGATIQQEPSNVATRILQTSTVYPDPLEEPISNSETKNQVPFWAAGKPKPGGLVDNKPDPYLDAQLTNELPRVPTRGDGTGEAFFDVQTLRQNAGFDCGAPVTVGSTTTGQSCWLVIVPRGSTEVVGQAVNVLNVNNRLFSSPLSRTNFNQKIAFKLEFLPVTQACPIGAAERPIFGHETPVEAVGRWQRTLCAGSGGALYTYDQVPDDQARSRLVGNGAPGLVLFSNPIPPDQVPPDRPLVYAPVTLSGVSIAFNVDHQPLKPDAKAGQRFPEMNLTPRLVAKLLTQSYRSAVSGTTGLDATATNLLKGNPESMTTDEDFLRYNPDYRGQTTDSSAGLPQPIVQLAPADTTALVWSWVLGDAQARAFLAGKPDDWGMLINPANKGIDTPPSNYPRGDQSCTVATVDAQFPPQPLCTADQFPYANDTHEGARAVGRGLDVKRIPNGYDAATRLVKYAKPSRQAYGQHHVMAVIDTATAARYEVPTAKLRPASATLNPQGPFIAATPDSMLAGLAAMKPSGVPGVQKPDPLTTDPAVYPLTTVSYAATAPALMDKAAGKDYANFLRYAVDKGQELGLGPGQLPFGYVPLPESLRAQTRAAAATIETKAGIPVSDNAAPDTTTPRTTTPGTTTPGTTTPGTTTPGTTTPGSTTSGPTLTPAGTDVTPPAPAGRPLTPGVTAPVVAARRTPALPAPAVGALLVALFVCGGVAATLAPVARFFGVIRSTETGEEADVTDRTEARSLPSWLAARLALLARRR